MGTRSYRDLIVWQRAMDLVAEVYELAKSLPPHERFGLASQMRRAPVSVPSNIAEGNGRIHRGDYIYHVSVARGSLMELETQFELIRRFSYAEAGKLREAEELLDHVGRMLQRLLTGLREGPAHSRPASPVPRPYPR